MCTECDFKVQESELLVGKDRLAAIGKIWPKMSHLLLEASDITLLGEN